MSLLFSGMAPYRKYATEEERKRALNESKRRWRERNKEVADKKDRERMRAKQRTPEGKRYYKITNWKKSGIVGDLENIYDTRYLHATHCEWCNTKFRNSRDRQLEHNHFSGAVRGVVCHHCNMKEMLKDANFKKVLAELIEK